VRSEAYALGIKLGADPALLATVINSSSGQVCPTPRCALLRRGGCADAAAAELEQ
jgi:hypothetical protein